MTRTPSSIIADEILPMIPPTILRVFDHLPTKRMRRLRVNRQLVSNLAEQLVRLSINLIHNELEPGKDILSQIGWPVFPSLRLTIDDMLLLKFRLIS